MLLVRSSLNLRWISNDVLRRRFGEPGLTASGQTGQSLSGFVRHETLGTPSDVPVPRKTMRDFPAKFFSVTESRFELFLVVPEIVMIKGYRLRGHLLMVIGIDSGRVHALRNSHVYCRQVRPTLCLTRIVQLAVNFVPLRNL